MTLPKMFPHQEQAALRIAAKTPTYLGFDMGIGKTRTFIEACKLADAKRVLILCPASAVLVWKREIATWHIGALSVVVKKPEFTGSAAMTTVYFIVSHGLMSQRDGAVAGAMSLCEAFDFTAVDEAQAYNAPDNIRVGALRRAARNMGLIVPLSGTPMKNHAGDLYTLTSICWPEGLKGMNRYLFEDTFCHVTHRRFHSRGPMVRVIEGSKNLDRLKTMLSPFIVRVRKEDVFEDLPAMNWDMVQVPLDKAMIPPADLTSLDNIVRDMLERMGATAGVDTMTEALTKLGGSATLMTLRRLLGLAKLRGAVEYIQDMLDNLPRNRKVLVFAHHADVITALKNHFGEYSPAVLTGKSTPQEREQAVDWFLKSDQCRVFIGNIQAAGTAITLVGPDCKCSDVVFVESSWTPMDNAQAACRVHRIGQKDGVVVRMLAASGTIDDLVTALLTRKSREFAQLFDTASSGSDKGATS